MLQLTDHFLASNTYIVDDPDDLCTETVPTYATRGQPGLCFSHGRLGSPAVRVSQIGPVILLAPEYDYGLRWVGAFLLHQIGTIARRF